jgi:hypothetical protein
MGARKKTTRGKRQDVQGVVIAPGQRYGDGTRDSTVYLKDVTRTRDNRRVKLAVLLREGQRILAFNINNVPIHGKELGAGGPHYDEYMSELARWVHGHPALNDKDKWHVFLIDREDLPQDVMHDFSTRIRITKRADYPQTMRWAVVYQGNRFDGGETIWGDTMFPYPWIGPGRRRQRSEGGSTRTRQPARLAGGRRR